MTHPARPGPSRPLPAPVAEGSGALADRAFTRAAGAALVSGNAVRLLRDAAENYPAWLAAIRAARRTIHFESYILYDDAIGREFADALADRARAGVRVRLLYDWLGAVGKTSGGFWRRLRAAGVEVRCFNPPRLDAPFGWVHRDHRKSLVVDRDVAFVTGLCVGQRWLGDPARGVEPWRDTGVELRGPAVADVDEAFGAVWRHAGGAWPPDEAPGGSVPPPAGHVAVRVVATEPWVGGMLRLDQLIAAATRERLWITDAYFAGIPSYVQAVCAAARDGVDVRLLVPGGSDLPILRPLSQAGYRPLLEAGVRVFEWRGPMLHAKTAVADGQWARVGSSNLNLASWLGNYELDLAVEDRGFADAMERQFERDLEHATELVLAEQAPRWRARRALTRVVASDAATIAGDGAPPLAPPGFGARASGRPVARRAGGSAARAAAGALRLGNAVSAAITERRTFTSAETNVFAGAGTVLLVLAVVAALWPRVLALPLAALLAWIALALLLRALRLWRGRTRTAAMRLPLAVRADAPPPPPPPPPPHAP